MKIEEMDIDLIKPYKNNPREIPMESVQKVMNSIREFGNNQPIVVDNDNVIVVGHTRWKALKQLGKSKAYIVKKDFPKGESFDLQLTGFNLTELENLANDKELGFVQNAKDLKENFNVDFPDGMEVTHVKMVQLFLNTETEKDFKLWCQELQTQLGTDNLSDTVYTVIKNAYNNSKS